MNPIKISITGSFGFIGSNLLEALNKKEFSVKVLANKKLFSTNEYELFNGDITKASSINKNFFKDCDVFIHLAGISEELKNSEEALLQYKKVNVDATAELVKLAIENRVKRFIFLSTSKVNEYFIEGKTADRDCDLYSYSKFLAENKLYSLADKSFMETVIIRPPIVYGPGVKGNFAKLINIAQSNYPLPFLNLKNKRALIAIENLIDFIILCANYKKSRRAANEVFCIRDLEEISTEKLIREIGNAYDTKVRLFFVPKLFFLLIGKILRIERKIEKIIGNHHLDMSNAELKLNWIPKISITQQLNKMANLDE